MVLYNPFENHKNISGVLTDSVEGGAVPIEGSVEAVKKYGTCQLNYYFGHKNAILSYHVCVITVRKRSLGQGNFFTPVCDSVHRGGWWCLPHCMLGYTLLPGPEADTPP